VFILPNVFGLLLYLAVWQEQLWMGDSRLHFSS